MAKIEPTFHFEGADAILPPRWIGRAARARFENAAKS